MNIRLQNSVLGLGINGKVVECFSRASGEKFALKVGCIQRYTLFKTLLTTMSFEGEGVRVKKGFIKLKHFIHY